MQTEGSWVGKAIKSELPVEMEIDWVKMYDLVEKHRCASEIAVFYTNTLVIRIFLSNFALTLSTQSYEYNKSKGQDLQDLHP